MWSHILNKRTMLQRQLTQLVLKKKLVVLYIQKTKLYIPIVFSAKVFFISDMVVFSVILVCGDLAHDGCLDRPEMDDGLSSLHATCSFIRRERLVTFLASYE